MIKINEKAKSVEDMATRVACGFSMTFENGNTISIQFGIGNYCSNKTESKSETQTAEIAIWDKSGKDYIFNDKRLVEGWANADEVAKWIRFAANNTF